MTLLGKIFTGLICILSLIFFSLAIAVNASHVNYRELVKNPTTGYEARVKAAEEKNRQLATLLEDAKSELSIEQAARRSALGALQTQIDQREQELASQEAELTKLLAAHTNLVATEQQTQQDLSARTKDNELLRKQNVEAFEDRNQLFARMTKAIDEYNRLQGMYQALMNAANNSLPITHRRRKSWTSSASSLTLYSLVPQQLTVRLSQSAQADWLKCRSAKMQACMKV